MVRVAAPLTRSDVVRAVAAASRRKPELCSRPSPLPLAAGVLDPVPDPGFDAEAHVSCTPLLPPESVAGDASDDHEIARAAARVWSRPLAADRPPWEVTLLHGRDGTAATLLVRAHRSLIDEGGGIDLARDLLAASSASPRESRPARLRSAGFPVPVLLRGVVSLAERGAQGSQALAAELRSLLRPGVALERTRNVGRFLESAGTLLSSPAPETPWNGPLGGARTLAWRRLSLDVLRGIAEAFGGTWSEACLTVLGEALGRHLRASGRATSGLELLVLLPCGLEPEEAPGEGTGRLVAVPVGEMAAAARHDAVRARLGDPVSAARAASLAPLVRLTLQLPSALQPTLGSLCYQAANTSVEVVHAPEGFSTAAGRTIVGVVPLGSLPWHTGLAISVLSWHDELVVGLTADPHRIPDVEELARLLHEAYVEVAAAAGVPAIDPARASL